MTAKKMPLAQHRRRSSDGHHRWTFERRISLDTIVGIVGIAIVIGGPLVLAYRAVDNRILTIEVKDEGRTKSDEKRDLEQRDFRNQISGQLSELSKQMGQAQILLGILSATKASTTNGK